MSDRVNLVRVHTTSTGTSTMTLGAAYSALFMTSAEAGMISGRTYTYLVTEGNDWELGKGVYTSSGTTLSRVTVLASRISGTLGTTKITLSGTAQVRIVESADDMGALRGTRVVTGTTDALAQSDLGGAVTYSNAASIAASIAQAGASGAFLDGWSVWVKNTGAGTLTITPTTSTINGAATLVLPTNMGAFIWSDGANYHAYVSGVASIAGNTGAFTLAYPISNSTNEIRYVGPTNSGKLTYVSATAVKFAPFNGDTIRISGVVYQIPAAGIAGVANTSVYVGGVAAQNLASSTLYYVYVFNNGGTLTADFRTGTHAISSTAGNIGTQILSGDDSRSLIGMIRTNASSQFVDSDSQRFVRSWFNESGTGGSIHFTATKTSTSGTLAELDSAFRGEFIVWTGERVMLNVTATMSSSAATGRSQIGTGFDGTPAPMGGLNILTNAADFAGGAAQAYSSTLSEGYHYGVIFGGGVASGTATYYGDVDGRRTGLVFHVHRN